LSKPRKRGSKNDSCWESAGIRLSYGEKKRKGVTQYEQINSWSTRGKKNLISCSEEEKEIACVRMARAAGKGK